MRKKSRKNNNHLPNKVLFPRSPFSMFLAFGKPGDVHYLNKTETAVHIMARHYQRKVSCKKCAVVPATIDPSKPIEVIQKVTIVK